MKCSGCFSKIRNVLSNMQEVIHFDVSLENNTVLVQGENIKGKQLKTVMENLGFTIISLKKTKS